VELELQASQLLFVSQLSPVELATDTCQQALHNASVHDFLIVEYNGEIGDLVALEHRKFLCSKGIHGRARRELGARYPMLIELKLIWNQIQGL
jgi:hypothetical protein